MRAFVYFTQPVNFDTVNALMRTLLSIRGQHPQVHVHLMITSPGGGINPGFALYEFLTGNFPDLVTVNTSSIDSIANVIFQAGSRRFATPTSTFLFHGVTWGFGTDAATVSAINEALTQLKNDENRIAAVLATRSEMTESEIRAHFQTGEAIPAESAFDRGLVDELAAPRPAHGDLVVSI